MMVTATHQTDGPQAQQAELASLLERFATTRREELDTVCGIAGDSMQRLVDRGQVPGYLAVEPHDPAPVVERTVLAALRRLAAAQR
ncbi:MAG: hypothetical protein ACLFUG_04220 [Nitriliruptoraceae bacterium]